MSKDKKQQALVPRLRFPEFRDAPEWRVEPLYKVAQFVKKKLPVDELQIEDYVSTENMLPDYGGIEKATKLPPSGSVTQYKPNDILIANIRPYLKKVWRATKSGGASNDVIVIRPKLGLRTVYLPFVLANDAFINHVMKTTKGVKMPRGDIASMKAYNVYYPEPAEQQKIAECLGSLDDLIAAEGRKLAALREHKKGLMQQLFPRKGETRPRLRFPEFRDSEGWREVAIRETAAVIAGQSPRSEYYNDIGNGTPFYQGKTDFGDVFINPPTKWTTQVTKLAIEDDILMSVRAPVGALNVSTQKICIGRGLAALRAKEDKWFLYYLLLQVNRLFVGNSGSVFDSISKSQIESTQIPFPQTRSEQQKIADCLASLDALIAAQAAKLDALRTHKRGLMQGLFPSPEDVGT